MDGQTTLEQRLEKIEQVVEENRRILIKMRRVQRNANLFRLLYWVVILALTFGAFYYIQPYIRQLTEIYTGFQDTQQNLKSTLPDVKYLDQLLNQIGGKNN